MAEHTSTASVFSQVLAEDRSGFLKDWTDAIRYARANRGVTPENEISQQCSMFFDAFRKGFEDTSTNGFPDSRWDELRFMLAETTKARTLRGFSATEIASFIFSFKEPLFNRLRLKTKDPELLAEQLWEATELLDSFGLYATDLWLKSREQVIRRHEEEMLELSTPVVKLWNNILALPLIGTLDSARTQVVMESLLGAIVETNSKVAILDITGVPTVDTVVAQHLLKTVTAARLMGADCIISGIRPQIAQTIVHLGINLLDITTKATLRDAFAVALERTGQSFGRNSDL